MATGLGATKQYGEGVLPSQMIFNAIRDSGLEFSPGSASQQRLLRMAPALQQAYMVQQALNPTMTAAQLADDELAGTSDARMRDFFQQAIAGGGGSSVGNALRNLDAIVNQARALAQVGGQPENPYLQALMGNLGGLDDITEFRNSLITPFLSGKMAQGFERGSQIGMLGLQRQAGRLGLGNPAELLYGKLPEYAPGTVLPGMRPPVAPFPEGMPADAAATALGGPAGGGIGQDYLNGMAPPLGGEGAAPQGLQLNPVAPPIGPGDVEGLIEQQKALLEEQKRQKQRLLPAGTASGSVYGGTASGQVYGR